MKRNIRVLIYPDAEGGFCVQCDDLSAYTQGQTIEEAMANMHEVVGLALEGESLADLGFAEDASLLVEIEMGLAGVGGTGARRAG